jgi:hypothetical protein
MCRSQPSHTMFGCSTAAWSFAHTRGVQTEDDGDTGDVSYIVHSSARSRFGWARWATAQ